MRISTPQGIESVLARAVIDDSGTWRSPNPLGADGLPATGEAALAGRIAYRIPDVLGRERARYAGRRVLVVGRGHSAFNVILDLIALRGQAPPTEVLWATRKVLPSQAFGGGGDDALPERGRLGERVHDLIEDGRTTLLEGFAVRRLDLEGEAVRVEAADGRVVLVDEIIGATGFALSSASLQSCD